MSTHYFITGFPGFIAGQLVERLISKKSDAIFTFLVQPKMETIAVELGAEIASRNVGFANRHEIVCGDITEKNLGIEQSKYQELCNQVTVVWHLAAIYDLSVPEAIAYRVNVVGTANVLDFCEDCKDLKRHDYNSTSYVSGKSKGKVLEAELDEGQKFKNHYESTKSRAEIEVRRRMHRIPTIIHRPGIVIGDSKTGETDKYDGPYYLIKLLMRVPAWMPMVNVGVVETKINLVPVDFLVNAMAEIGTKDEAIGKTIQYADPNPRTSKEIVDGILGILGHSKAVGSVPASLAEKALSLRALRKRVELPKESIEYFSHPVLYDTKNQIELLNGSGIQCPDLLSYLPTIVNFVKKNPVKEFNDGRKF